MSQICVTIFPLDQMNKLDLPTLCAPTQKEPYLNLAENIHKGEYLVTGHIFMVSSIFGVDTNPFLINFSFVWLLSIFVYS